MVYETGSRVGRHDPGITEKWNRSSALIEEVQNALPKIHSIANPNGLAGCFPSADANYRGAGPRMAE
jgi:hypothetical protein